MSIPRLVCSEIGGSDCVCARGRRVRAIEVAVCNVRALALSVPHSRSCASVVVLSLKKDGPSGMVKRSLLPARRGAQPGLGAQRALIAAIADSERARHM
eukprot:6541494-Prymnesium_polylepis.1